MKRGTLTSHRGIAVWVRDDEGVDKSFRVPRNSGYCVGDEVEIEGDRISVQPRKNEIHRKSPGGGVRLLGANLDALAVVIAPRPAPKIGLVDRIAVAARDAGVHAVVIVNKSDLEQTVALMAGLREEFGDAIELLSVSAVNLDGIENLKTRIGELGRVLLCGHSGVGKSSLVNVICPEAKLQTGNVSDATNKGRHVTSASTLHQLESGGEIIDTPGVREFGIVDVPDERLAELFIGFEELDLGGCKFRNCMHTEEPGCVVRENAPAQRYAAYRAILLDQNQTRS